MITFTPRVYAHQRRKDGSYNVKINVYFKGKERRLPTPVFCTQEDLTRSLKIKNGTIRTQCEKIIMDMRAAVADLSPYDLMYQDVDFVVQKINEKLAKKTFYLDFFAHADLFIAQKKEGTAQTYRASVNAFATFLGKRECSINAITKAMIMKFVEFWESQPKHCGSGATSRQRIPMQSSVVHVRKLAAIFKDAKRVHNDEDNGCILIPRSPFDDLPLKVEHHSEGEKALPQELMQRIISAEAEGRERLALDLFIVSFALMGANIADLRSAEQPKGDVWVYYRQKTRDRRADRAEMRVRIPEQIQGQLRRLGAGTGRLWLPMLKRKGAKTEGQALDEQRRLTARVNSALRSWCAREGIEPFTFYAARKTWATLARREGVDKALVDECLAHVGNFSLTDIYAERAWHLMDEANGRVLSLFRW